MNSQEAPIESESPSAVKGRGLRAGALLKIRRVLCGKVRLLRRQIVAGKNGVLRADIGAVAAIDALVGVDEDLGYSTGGRIARRGRNGGRGALRRAYKVQRTGIGNYISHDEKLLDCF